MILFRFLQRFSRSFSHPFSPCVYRVVSCFFLFYGPSCRPPSDEEQEVERKELWLIRKKYSIARVRMSEKAVNGWTA